MTDPLNEKEAALQKRLEKIKSLEDEIKKREKAIKEKEKTKKQMVLWNDIAAWAEDDFRSINGQVEYLLSECVKRRHSGK